MPDYIFNQNILVVGYFEGTLSPMDFITVQLMLP